MSVGDCLNPELSIHLKKSGLRTIRDARRAGTRRAVGVLKKPENLQIFCYFVLINVQNVEKSYLHTSLCPSRFRYPQLLKKTTTTKKQKVVESSF